MKTFSTAKEYDAYREKLDDEYSSALMATFRAAYGAIVMTQTGFGDDPVMTVSPQLAMAEAVRAAHHATRHLLEDIANVAVIVTTEED